MEWSRPTQQGDIPSPRAGHAGVTIGENWFIVGGGDNRGGMYLLNFCRLDFLYGKKICISNYALHWNLEAVCKNDE